MNKEPIVFIIDDDDEVRSALAFLMESVGLDAETYSSAELFSDRFDPSKHGCILLDVRMRGMSGLMLQEVLAQHKIHPPIIFITGHGDVPMAVNAIKAGAIDFIQKPFNDQVLLESVYRAIEKDEKQRGKAYQHAEIQQRLNRLTPREREVIDLVVRGFRNKNIAYELHITQSTVEVHRSRAMEKMEANSLSDLMRIMLSSESSSLKLSL
jgi:RNA polymerase sigma factor (sigma-70 family)